MNIHIPLVFIIFIKLSGSHSNITASKLSEKFRYMCSHDKLTVEGFDIKISDVLEIECIDNATFIEIFALDRIIVDENIDKTGLAVQLSMIAPKWEVLSESVIALDGIAGKSHSNPKAFNGVGNGRSGKPGQPGGNSGSFFGVGKTFNNDAFLKITANGGNGGAGQDGGEGLDNFFLIEKFYYFYLINFIIIIFYQSRTMKLQSDYRVGQNYSRENFWSIEVIFLNIIENFFLYLADSTLIFLSQPSSLIFK